MIKQYFTQAWAQLRQQPMISAVSIAGTALAIFLIMLVVMMQQVISLLLPGNLMTRLHSMPDYP